MRILNWVHQKLNARHTSKKSTLQDACINSHKASKDGDCETISSKHGDLKNWQHGLLTIGTFGNLENDEQSMEDCKHHENPSSPHDDLTEFTLEEVGKLKRELTKYLALKHSTRALDQDAKSKEAVPKNDCPLNKFLNCPSTLEFDWESCPQVAGESAGENEGQDDHSIVASKSMDVSSSSTRLSRRSFSFLLKTMFTCQGGSGPIPSLREPPMLRSRMEKLLKVILRSRIGRPSSTSSGNKFIQCKSVSEMDPEEERKSQDSEKCKGVKADSECWVKTDSEFIVLEM
ncbi:protein DEEPER ROOTING 1-like [Nymphaea colorata]|nr:protein DEEPER ROOTING 1-like [Nymphaea colorata]